jgi:SagB-type dehydrogenase family enzyme
VTRARHPYPSSRERRLQSRRYVRSPHIAIHWRNRELLLEQFQRRRAVAATPLLVSLLHLFGRPRTLESVRRAFLALPNTRAILERLVRLEFLVPATRRRGPEIVATWKGAFAAAYFHRTTSDVRYVVSTAGRRRFFLERLALAPQPSLFKTYPGAPRVRLDEGPGAGASPPLAETLRRRRTVREFDRHPVELADLSTLLNGTWGRTGWIDAGALGRLLSKTSPSAGARHPIECYVIAWRVRGLAPGLYHYGVKSRSLERLRRGNFRSQAVRFASGQQWIGDAAFLCVLTALAGRVFWKYGSSDAYRLFFLDAGHLGQTFALLATALGLGPFTTAAVQETKIQDFLGLDGVREFPIYLCGAGIPRTRISGRVSPTS